jgi:signal peptidase II
MYKYRYRKILNVIIIAALIFIDQFSKYIIRLRRLADGGFYICNKNIAFGIQIPDFLFWLFWVAVAIVLVWNVYKKHFLLSPLSFLLILSGAISNIIDRIYLGCIVDFIDLKFWPVFNLADVFITIGAIMLISKMLNLKSQK